jgi:hypothetical protein
VGKLKMPPKIQFANIKTKSVMASKERKNI